MDGSSRDAPWHTWDAPTARGGFSPPRMKPPSPTSEIKLIVQLCYCVVMHLCSHFFNLIYFMLKQLIMGGTKEKTVNKFISWKTEIFSGGVIFNTVCHSSHYSICRIYWSPPVVRSPTSDPWFVPLVWGQRDCLIFHKKKIHQDKCKNVKM